MSRKKIALWGLLAAFAAFAAWTALSIPEPPAPIPESEQKPKEMAYGENTIREEIGGRLLWELTTSTTKVDVNTQATTFKDAKGKYCFEDGRVLTLTAAAGSYDSKAKNLKLTDGVQAVMSDGSRITAKSLEWVGGEDRLVAEGDAHVSQPGISVKADRIETWDQFQEFRATGHAQIVKEKD
ncbi:MAG: LPS export ABC transporter periplasmic protein LptC [Schwartzia sp.]|nr:LPS export ABC transporter periplasmic protein LptC [Schwartzia sp. (in: firmicutes)]